jgi:adenylate cyclase class 2
LLDRAAFRVVRTRAFETNLVLDTGDGRMRRGQRLLRIRTVDGSAVLTYKGPPQPGVHKIREELELGIEDPKAMLAVFERLGFSPVFRYEKYRTAYSGAAAAGHVLLDETPIGTFLELEGPPDWIDETAATLGFSKSDYVTASYGRLWRQHCDRLGERPGDMVFSPLETGDPSE